MVEGLQEGKIFLKYTGETALYILENVPGAMQYIKARYSHIIIDEYQDCGEIQDKVFIKLVESGLCRTDKSKRRLLYYEWHRAF